MAYRFAFSCNPITLSLYDPTAKISDHTFLVFYPTILVFYPTIRGEIPLFYYYITIPLLLFLSSPKPMFGVGVCPDFVLAMLRFLWDAPNALCSTKNICYNLSEASVHWANETQSLNHRTSL